MRTTSILFLLLLFCGAYAQPEKLHFNAAKLAAELQAQGLSAEEVEHRIGEQYRNFIAQHQPHNTNSKPVTSPLVMADSICNADVELGNLYGLSTATTKNSVSANILVGNYYFQNYGLWPTTMAQYPVMDSTRILITDKNYTDKCNVVNPVSPNGNYSILLGDTSENLDMEELYYTFTVSPNNYRFGYWFSVVDQNSGHYPASAPSFSFKLYHQGDTFPMSCLPGSHQYLNPSSNNYLWKKANLAKVPYNCGVNRVGQACPLSFIPWTKRVIDLSAYMGQTLTAVFTNADCGEGGHFGYSYVDIDCGNADSVENVFMCNQQDSVQLFAQFEHNALPTTIPGSIGIPKPIEFATTGVSYSWLPINKSTASVWVKAPGIYTVTTTVLAKPNPGSYSFNRIYRVLIDTVNSNIQITNPGTLCTTSSPVVLNATPTGGTFSGTGVTGANFSPSVAGIGTHVITYDYVSPLTGCSYSDTMQIKVDVCMGTVNLLQSKGELTNTLLSLSNFAQMQLYAEKLNRFTNIKISDVSGKVVYIGKTIDPDNLMQLSPAVYIVSCGSSMCNHKLFLME